ncbi:Uncharacterized protein dnl_28880 [Desulfonema limicola]|uniref:Hemolysin n=1 Tax=Desulfonema limicola TaxID=45656 RepID=A0A975B7Z6_9BACT|nr:DUF333 domain-containing protein [Desulfonema limicola]QTA80581.1 Uncharacterized protein dnl_28880 [Desulfonema limicola]
MFKALFFIIFICLTGCVKQTTYNTETKGNMGAVPNPAAEKCIRDGYKLEPIMENGIPDDYICVNPETGKKCEIWKYFRNECNLQ